MLKRIIRSNFTPYLVIVLLGILVCIPFFTINLSEYTEFKIHIIRVTNVKELIGDGVFPPLISYKHINSFGYGLNLFYGVFTTYIPILISFFTNSSTMAIKIFTVLSVIFSGITMYVFTYEVSTKKSISLISALIYMIAPYKITDIYSRYALGEYVAFIFIPMVFHGLYCIMNKNQKVNYIFIIGTSLLILTHNITAVYTAFFCLIYLLLNYNKVDKFTFLKSFVINMLLVLLLTSFYTIQIIEHKILGDYCIFNADDMRATGEIVYENTNNISDWFKISLFHTGMNYSFGIIIIFFILITLFIYKKIDKSLFLDTWLNSFIYVFKAFSMDNYAKRIYYNSICVETKRIFHILYITNLWRKFILFSR